MILRAGSVSDRSLSERITPVAYAPGSPNQDIEKVTQLTYALVRREGNVEIAGRCFVLFRSPVEIATVPTCMPFREPFGNTALHNPLALAPLRPLYRMAQLPDFREPFER